jgi:hypothetical protein
MQAATALHFYADILNSPNKPLEWTGQHKLSGAHRRLHACHSGSALANRQHQLMTSGISHEDNLVIQSYVTIALLTELCNNNLLGSPFFGEMTFGSPWIKEQLRVIGIDNQGCAIIALYAMLVLPREITGQAYATEYDAINSFLSTHTQHTTTTYQSDSPATNYIRHIRNAVSHGRIEFRPNDVIIFKDENNRANESFSTELPLMYLGELVSRLQNVHLAYINNMTQRGT